MISYSQNFEDVILERYFKDKNEGFYIDIGAAYPELCSVTKHFYEKGWHGINVEPSPNLFELLEKERVRDINLNIVVSEQNGEVDFYHLPNTGLSSIIEEFVISIINQNLDDLNGDKIKVINRLIIESSSLEKLFEKYAKNVEVDFLKIDVEGAEEQVIKSNNWDLYRPKVLVVEATLPNSQVESYESWDKLLVDADYSFVYFDGLNRFYLRNDLNEDKKYFSYPPCVFDDFIRSSEFEMQKKLQRDYSLQLKELQLKNNEFQLIIQKLTLRVNDLMESFSWRITKPLRLGLKFLINRPFSSFITKIRERDISKLPSKSVPILTKSILEKGKKDIKKSPNPNGLKFSPRVQKIYSELKKAINQD